MGQMWGKQRFSDRIRGGQPKGPVKPAPKNSKLPVQTADRALDRLGGRQHIPGFWTEPVTARRSVEKSNPQRLFQGGYPTQYRRVIDPQQARGSR